MKTFTRLTMAIAIFTLGFTGIGNAQLLLNEDFNYPAGDLITAHGWVAHSGAGTQPITVGAPGLVFPGYIGSGIGGAALLDNNGEDDHYDFTPVSSGVVYASFMVNVTTAVTGYFFHFGVTPFNTTFRPKVFMSSTNQFGLSKGSNTATLAASTFTPGTTYLLVVKYEIIAGTFNDEVSLFVFDGAIPGTEPLATIGPLTDAAQSDINPSAVALRQFISTENITVDGIRVATTWADLLGNSPQPIPTMSEWALILLGAALMGVGGFYITRRRKSAVTV